MILDHEWMAAAAGLVEHSPGIVSSVIGIVLYALLRDGIPYYKRKRNGNPGNPGNLLLAERLLACEEGIREVKEACARADERWNAQRDFNKRVDKHFERIHDRLDK
ncbi:hypothetical protein LCGC14_0466720 [marine sediment metagenome]|uniref:Uncharacterized protein n=1 Tax=marine sediment metagenome TaxID=412755 RepID=A0A0F9SWA5_9ZZZZ